MTPHEAIENLKQGNERFVQRKTLSRNHEEQIKKTAHGQTPHSVILGCMDSRVPPEVIFDQGIGDIFVVRHAGNHVDTNILGSLEFATSVSGAGALVILGHTDCGAIKGAADHVRLGHLTRTLQNLSPALDAVTDIKEDRTSLNPDFIQAVVEANVRLTHEKILQESSVIKGLVGGGKLKIQEAIYNLSTGQVTF